LTNVRQRLEQLYGPKQKLDLVPNADGGVRVQIHLPYRE
jgi:sensor histidine kinase YesM